MGDFLFGREISYSMANGVAGIAEVIQTSAHRDGWLCSGRDKSVLAEDKVPRQRMAFSALTCEANELDHRALNQDETIPLLYH